MDVWTDRRLRERRELSQYRHQESRSLNSHLKANADVRKLMVAAKDVLDGVAPQKAHRERLRTIISELSQEPAYWGPIE